MVVHVAKLNVDNINAQTEMVNNNYETQTDQQYNNIYNDVSNKLHPLIYYGLILVLVLIVILLCTVIHYVMELRSIQHQLSILITAQSITVLDNDTIITMLLKNKTVLDYEQDHKDTKFQGTDNWSQQLAISIKDQYQVTPAILNVKNENKNNNNFILSNPFFTFKEGHLMIMRVYPNGFGTGKGTHISVVFLLMKGPHDDELEQSGHWPLRGTFTIELLNQLNDSNHYSHMLQFHHYMCTECTNRVLKGVMAHRGFGLEQFMSLQHNNSAYYKNGSLTFRTFYEDIQPPFQVAPVILS